MTAASCSECGAPPGRIHGFKCSRYPDIVPKDSAAKRLPEPSVPHEYVKKGAGGTTSAAKSWREPKPWMTKAEIEALVAKILAPAKEALTRG